jgi:hypothetical protein
MMAVEKQKKEIRARRLRMMNLLNKATLHKVWEQSMSQEQVRNFEDNLDEVEVMVSDQSERIKQMQEQLNYALNSGKGKVLIKKGNQVVAAAYRMSSKLSKSSAENMLQNNILGKKDEDFEK